LPPLRADGAAHLRLADLDEDLLGPPLSLSTCQRQDGTTLHLGRDGQTGRIQQRGRQIEEADELPDSAAAEERPARQCGGNADRALVAGALVFAVARLEVAAVIGREEQDRVLA